MATIGLKELRYAVLDKNEKTAQIYDLPGAIEAKVDVPQEVAKLYADDGLYKVKGSGVNEIKIELNIADLETEDKERILGVEVVDGIEKYGENTDPPYVAVTFKQATEGGSWYFAALKGKFSVPATEGKTKEDKVEWTTPTVEGEFLSRKVEQKGYVYFLAFDGHPSFSEEKFYEEVYGALTNGSGTQG